MKDMSLGTESIGLFEQRQSYTVVVATAHSHLRIRSVTLEL